MTGGRHLSVTSLEVSAVLPTRRRPGIATALIDSGELVSAAFVTCCHLCRLTGFTPWDFICMVSGFITECIEQAALLPGCSRCLCEGAAHCHRNCDHRGLFHSGRLLLQSTVFMEDCSQGMVLWRTFFRGHCSQDCVHGEQSTLNHCWRICLMPFGSSTHPLPVTSIMFTELNHRGRLH